MIPADLFHTYMRGWTAGAAVRPTDLKFMEHDEPRIRETYEEGYASGIQSRSAANEVAQKLSGYVPSILRDGKLESTSKVGVFRRSVTCPAEKEGLRVPIGEMVAGKCRG